MTALPTKRDETWRYSDIDALSRIWPVAAPERIVVPAGESVARRLIQSGDAAAIHDITIELQPGARFAMHIANSGDAFGRIAIDVALHEGADFQLDAALIGGGRQTLEIVTTVRHLGPGASSRQTVRAIAGGRATVNYLGKVAVARAAQKTDAVQSVKAMLLARTATANLKPELEIFADDVKCAHGATVGELDAQALFYLASRGLPPPQAQALLLRAFVGGLFDGLAEGERADFTAAIDAALERML